MNAGFQLNAFDPSSLGELQRLARAQGRSTETLRAASRQFEALFLQMVLKSMREATPASGLMDSEQTKLYRSLLDQQLALELAHGKGTGLAEVVFRQLGGQDESRGAIAPPGSGQRGPASGFELGPGVRRAANPAARARTAESAAADLVAASAEATDRLSVAARAALDARVDAAVRSARAAGGKVSEQARAFVNEVWPHALSASARTGIPPEFMVAQAALETGWGQRQLRHADGSPSHNLFNIKAGSSWNGRTVDLDVTEYAGQQPYSAPARFRAYASYAESFRDYARLISDSPRYAGVLGQTDAVRFARGLQDAGYATDPMYADKLTRIIGGNTLRNALAFAG